MKKDIDFHQGKHLSVVAIKEWDNDMLSQQWNVYIVNHSEKTMETTLVVARGSSEEKKTSTLRYNVKDLKSNTWAKIEFLQDEVLSFTNEYLVTYFQEDKLFERKFVFEPHSISEKNTVHIELLDEKGIYAISK